MHLSTVLSYDKPVDPIACVVYTETMPQENLSSQLLDLLKEHHHLTLEEIHFKLKNKSRYIYLKLRDLIHLDHITCVNGNTYVYGSMKELLETRPDVSMSWWYDAEKQYLPVTRTDLVNYLIENKPNIPESFTNAWVMEGYARYVWYCLEHPHLDTSYLTFKEGYDKEAGRSQFNTLKDSLVQ